MSIEFNTISGARYYMKYKCATITYSSLAINIRLVYAISQCHV